MKTTGKIIHIRLVLAALTCLVLTALPARATVIASDTFSITEDRPVGSYIFKPAWTSEPTAAVKGSTETGADIVTSLTYNSNINQDQRGWILAGDAENGNGYVTRTGGSSAASLALPFNFNTWAQYGDVATWELRIQSRKPGSGDYSFRISFYTTGDVTAGNAYNALVSLYINPLGNEWSLRSGNTIVKDGKGEEVKGLLSEALGADYSSDTFYTYSISYNNSTKTVTDVSINGTTVVSNYVFETSPGAIGNVGFFGQWTDSITQIDTLTLSVNATPPPVPEPAAAALVMTLGVFGATGILRLRLRNRR
ncbi:MAG: hypothetical protein LBK99_22330 [Opitutaceae bacterium]|jgi:hypothetical protein|nr:hypothetical protein [Opitutaceae bacterium]